MVSQPPSQVKILIVDDDEIILYALKETLASTGYELLLHKNPLDALKHLQEKDDQFSVIVSDQRMTHMTGLEFLTKAKKIQPNASRILITGVLTLKIVIDAVNRGEIFRFLAKPWMREELMATIQNAVQRYQLLTLNKSLQDDTLQLNEQLAHTNAELKRKVKELTEQKQALDNANSALMRNFERSLTLSLKMLSTFNPSLGRETKAVVDICQLIIDTGYLSIQLSHILRVSAWLNNMGLLGMSRGVLDKYRNQPEALTSNEIDLIKNHTIYGQYLASFADDLDGVGETIRASHERWDGTGYPDGLRSRQIPEPARYLAVAIYYVECRQPKEKALDQILKQSGKAFDPEAVRLFMKATRLDQLPQQVKEVLFSELEPGMRLAKGIYAPNGL
ncbi:MAG: HD domain-containing phosphohydrolase, partial [Verrucomicrobiota bacterium]